MADLPGFSDPNVEIEDEGDEIFKPKSNKKSGGFQSMGLSPNVLKGIAKRGYKIPTPIQRKTIPLVLEGRDVVAMARTGSGKTACFLIPMFEKLKIRSAKSGARAIILSPTRELALQTLKFIKEIGRFAGLRAEVILGGDSMDDQFSAIHGNPDVIVATPGRLLHICVEMDLKLNSVEYIVFDEADRLFEMGFGEQLNEIIHRLPDTRQTLLFSATVPKVLVDFAKVGLNDPVLLRLDVESKLPEELTLWFLTVRPEEHVSALLVLLKSQIAQKEKTIVFAATKHHVEYLHMILDHIGISNTYIYSSLDPSARKINAAKFSQNKVNVLVVTDVAARGIDIPQLDNVINFNFPAKPKLFIHRVGRCARAGRSGTAYSLVASEEYPFLLDLHLFLGRPLTIATASNRGGTVGRIPQTLLEEQHSTLLTLHQNYADVVSMKKVTENAYLQYVRSRPVASSDSSKRIKDMPFNTCAVHQIFKDSNDQSEERENMLDKMKNYRPQGTIFEICGKNKSKDYLAMKEKRSFHKDHIMAFRQKQEQKLQENETTILKKSVDLPKSNEEEISEAFKEVVVPKKRKFQEFYNKKPAKKAKKIRDENYIPHVPKDLHSETGLSINTFQQEANRAQFDITGDSNKTMRQAKQLKKWDRKKKKFITIDPNSKQGKIKTESGAWIPATYKSNRYAQWKERSKADENDDDDDDNEAPRQSNSNILKGRPNTHWARHNEKLEMKKKKSEFKSTDQIMKARKIADKKKARQKKKGKGKGKGRKR